MPPGWYPDPSGANAWAWWSGTHWVHTGPLGASPYGYSTAIQPVQHQVRKWFPYLAPLRIEAAYFAVATALVLLAMNLIGVYGNGLLAGIVGVVSLGFAFVGFPLASWFASRQWGTGSMVNDFGLRSRWVDIPLGFAGAIGLYLVAMLTSLLMWIIQLPSGSNLSETEDLANESPELRVFLFVILFVMAGIIAPITEELLFRGALMRGLMSKFGRWQAVLIQGAIFGSIHFTPSEGWGNVSMLLVLGSVGVGLGALTHLTGRLMPAIIAHSVFNCANIALLWLTL